MSTSDAFHKGDYNVFHDYSVVLNHPIDEVFDVLGVGDHMERVVRLSVLCHAFELGAQDTVVPSGSAPLTQSSVRTLPSAPSGPDQEQEPGALPRRAFVLQEAVPVLFALVTTHVRIAGAQTWDPAARVGPHGGRRRGAHVEAAALRGGGGCPMRRGGGGHGARRF